MVAVDDDAGACGRGVPTLINNMFSMNAFNVKRVFLMWFRCDFFYFATVEREWNAFGWLENEGGGDSKHEKIHPRMRGSDLFFNLFYIKQFCHDYVPFITKICLG